MPELVTATDTLVLTAVLAYLLGSIPFGVLVTRAMGLGDLRRIGSGNIGATNVLRTGNKGAALATLLLDGGKGALAVVLARAFLGAEDAAQLAGLAAFLGHLYPVWLGFKGGKGVATFLGLMLALDWRVGLACCATWAVAVAVTRISSVGALVAAALSPLWLFAFDHGRMLLLTMILTVLIYIRHAANLARLKAGTEPKIGQKKPQG
ncbi:glycerol-3-phosphate 1-O-acyltransferase PlsY [Rhodobacter sp. SGA-6-6]|uniref:glycerol-3-phosphate 1-O-acyltransferase PlsY n=1 Tax=Rhodobacter sp. SGA-6-6 TaxID=2710882 RepID=UPI0013EE3725|nr:glycerol-3-phosphate 1-O-acyltransferase PlsY [Rhodobacter sp. SGA-6-6]NGM44988.1 glycerol-3-phosphate 1-O-acyltransferase PlsY [Rhodobacter sp. SGA-6-6]